GQNISQSGGLRGRLRESWEELSDEEFCKTDANPFTGTATSTGWKHGIFRNQLSWVGNRMMKEKWATWMNEKRGGHNIGQKGGQGKMHKRRP
ncbi:hypothetical protein D6D13_08904, partial [Aureobasidium pullulans]